MAPRRKALVAASVLLPLVLAAALIWSFAASEPYSSPTAIRTNEAYVRAHAPLTKLPAFDTNLFKSAFIEKTETGFTIKYEAGLEPPWHAFTGSASSHKADSTGTIRLGNGSIQLSLIGVVTEPPQERNSSSIPRSSPKYFTPDLKPADQDHPLFRLEPYRQDLMAHKLPEARFIFTSNELAEFVTRRFDAFDARTHFPLATWNYRRGPFRDTISFDVPIKVWHQTPIELLITLATGSTEIYSAPATEGTELQFPGGALKLLAIAEGGLEVVHLPPGTPTNTVFLTQSADTPTDRPVTTLVFYQWPTVGLLPWNLEFVDDAGNAMSAGWNAGSGPIFVRTVDLSRDRLKGIRVKRYPNVHTLSFTIPELPGLPEQNRNLQNLFDLHIPHLAIQSLPFLKLSLGDLVQMEVQNLSLGGNAFRNPSFQRQRTNTTARALLEEIAASLPEHYTLVIDPEKNEIRARRNPLAGPIDFIKSLFRMEK